MNPNTSIISRRQKTDGPNHHLFHGTLHKPDGTAERLRANLKTRDESQARRKRDVILSRFSAC